MIRLEEEEEEEDQEISPRSMAGFFYEILADSSDVCFSFRANEIRGRIFIVDRSTSRQKGKSRGKRAGRRKIKNI